MICYKDMTFCSSDCTMTSCHSYWDETKNAAAQKWWGKPGAPVAFSDFSDCCAGYTKPIAEEGKQ